MKLSSGKQFDIINQPKKDCEYVSKGWNDLTINQCGSDNIWVMAHNYLGGRYLYKVKVGDIIKVVDGNGVIRKYKTEEIRKYKYVNLINQSKGLKYNGKKYTVKEVYEDFNSQDNLLILQTCLVLNNGFYFIIAKGESK